MSADKNDRGDKPLFKVEGISLRFSGIVALDSVSFAVGPCQICGMIGPNGAGESTHHIRSVLRRGLHHVHFIRRGNDVEGGALGGLRRGRLIERIRSMFDRKPD